MTTSPRSVAASLAIVLAIAATCALGFWQLRRAAGKEALQASLETAARARPAAVDAAALTDPQTMVYKHWQMRGRWLPDEVVYLDNRPHDGQAGFYVLMPLLLEEPGAAEVIVNRGWLPRDANDRARIAAYRTPAGPVDVRGVALAEEPRLMELAAPGVLRLQTIWQNFDGAAFARASGKQSVALVVREDAASGDAHDGLARDWPDRGGVLQSQIDRHHGYAFQWFALAATFLALGAHRAWRVFRGVRHGRLVSG